MPENDTLKTAVDIDALLSAADTALQAGDIQGAAEQAERAYLSSLDIQDPDTRKDAGARAQRLQARALWQCGQIAQSYACAVQAQPYFEQRGARTAAAELRDLAALALCTCGLAEDALPLLQANVDAASEPPVLFDTLAQSLSSLAHTHASLGRYTEAELLHLQALSRARESSDAQTLARAYANLLLSSALACDALMRKGQDTEARALACRHLRFAHQAKAHMDAPGMNPRQKALIRVNIGLNLVHSGLPGEARPVLEEGLRQALDSGSLGLVQSLQLALGECAMEERNMPLACQYLEPLLQPQQVQPHHAMLAPLLRLGIRLRQAQCLTDQAARLQQRLDDLEADQARCHARTQQDIHEIQQRLIYQLQPPAPAAPR